MSVEGLRRSFSQTLDTLNLPAKRSRRSTAILPAPPLPMPQPLAPSSMEPSVPWHQAFEPSLCVREANAWLDVLKTTDASPRLVSLASPPTVGLATGEPHMPMERPCVWLTVWSNETTPSRITGPTNGLGDSPLLEEEHITVIAIGRTDGSHQQGSVAVDGFYGAGHTAPTLVVAVDTTSCAMAVVSAAATLIGADQPRRQPLSFRRLHHPLRHRHHFISMRSGRVRRGQSQREPL
jgi:hypothetical protein